MVAGSEADAVASAWGGAQGVEHGEGAFWDDEAQVFRYVDMLAGDLLTCGPEGTRRTHLGDVLALVRRRRAGGFVVAVERGFLLLDEDLRVDRSVTAFSDRSLRMNEGACDPAGRLFCGSMAYDARPGAGSVFRLDPDLSIHVALDGVTIPNGLLWTADGTRAYHADTGDDLVHVMAYDAVSGAFGERRPFLRFDDHAGSPDGMALDVEGGLWVASWGGGAVQRFDPDGRLTETIRLPVTRVTSCAFGGQSGRTLFITTSRVDVPTGTEPSAGQVHAIDVGVRGAPVHRFTG